MPLRPILLSVLLAAAPFAADAASLDLTLGGRTLSIDTPRARSVEIVPDASLHDRVVVHATADRQQELDALILESGDGAKIRSRHSDTWHMGASSLHFSLGDTPTMALRISVPPSFAIAIDESDASRYKIGRVDGPLNLDVSGQATIDAEHAHPLNIDLSGEGSVTIDHAEGPIQVEISGHGDVSVGEAHGSDLSVSLSGAGGFNIARGRIDHASLDDSGFGTMRISAEVGDASVDLSGAGGVYFARVTGNLEKDVSGLGNVTVGE